MQLSRRTARESVMKALYALELSEDSLEHILETLIKPKLQKDAKLLAFAESLFLKSVRDTKKLDEIITKYLDNWDFKRVAVIDKCILRMALCELMNYPDIPTKVTINEAIEIGKLFSTEQSGRFINGILDAATADLKKSGDIKKSGVGLIDK